jgi:hypothetical protein
MAYGPLQVHAPKCIAQYTVNGAVLAKDETGILSWSDDRTMRLWDVATGRQTGHET